MLGNWRSARSGDGADDLTDEEGNGVSVNRVVGVSSDSITTPLEVHAAAAEVPDEPLALRWERFEDFAGDVGESLVRLARAMLRDPHQAEDVVQDVLAKVFVRWRHVRALDAPDAYARAMVANHCRSWWRRPARREAAVAEPREDHPTPQGAPERVAEYMRIQAELTKLSGRQRAVLTLRFYADLPDAEIAHLLGMRETTVRGHAFEGLRKLRALLDTAT